MNKKKVLLISYSQTGQLNDVLSSLSSPLLNNTNIEVTHHIIKPKKNYPFPWNFFDFMDCFPESVYLEPCEIENIEDNNDYDLIILAYQVWFLSPSIPITSFLKSSWAKQKFKNKPVITLIGCRNMWIMAQEKIKKMLLELDAKLIDNVVLIDKGNSLETFITTPRWMLTGKKNSIFGLSSAGIDENEIIKSQRFGKALVDALLNNKEKENKSLLYGLKAVEVNIKLIKSEQIGIKSFMIWGNLIRKIGKQGSFARKPVLIIYLLFLLSMIITVVPINMIIQSILRKINKKLAIKQKEFYELPSGSGNERMKEYQ
ncbi:dialkylrecorsinol condensing enzyme [Arcobacter sp.]|uniref:dialkylrecorsinol condensing enzyme n=1 Tax=Arcobacter sp. TaxID=1872629 RepID=UPI003D0AC46D